MTKQTLIMITILLVVIITAVTILLVLERDPGELIELLTVTLIPALLIWTGNRADKAVQVATQAAENSEQAVHNTNGRLGQFIQDAIDRGGKVDVDEYADVIEHQGITVPEDQAIHGAPLTEEAIEKAYDELDARRAERTQHGDPLL